jgi:RNA polymerase sigma-70 factor (ECF subfamily)
MVSQPLLVQGAEALNDEEIVQRVLAGETAWFEVIMRRYNQRLYRVARSIVHDPDEAEDIIQDAYVRAFQHLRQFAGRAKFSTWLTRIAVHEALARARRQRRFEDLAHPDADNSGDPMNDLPSNTPDPERVAATVELARFLEQAIDALPDAYRSVFMLREVEEMSTEEAAACLDITEENVKTRLHRARAMLRRELYARAGANSSVAFQFMAARCDRTVARVFERISALSML